MSEVWHIYKLTCTETGKSYIGITKRTLRVRWLSHVSRARNGQDVALSRAIRKYGAESFVLEHLGDVKSFEDAAEDERRLIADHGTMTPGGYNLTTGGEATYGRRVSAESREKMAAAKRGKPGPKWTPESRLRASESRKRQVITPEWRTRMSALRKEHPEWTAAAIKKARQTKAVGDLFDPMEPMLLRYDRGVFVRDYKTPSPT